MRTYIVYYYKEINDECVDCEKKVNAFSIRGALTEFETSTTVFKRVYKIEEVFN